MGYCLKRPFGYHWSLRKRREGESSKKLLNEIMTENFPNLGRDWDIQIYEAQQVSKQVHPKRSFAKHIMIKLSEIKSKEKILKTARD